MTGEQTIDEVTMNDPIAMQAMFDAMEKGEDYVATDATAEDPDVSTEAKPVEPAVAVVAPAPEAEPDGIATKDGKHIIPYSVLKADRDRANRAEQTAKELQDQIATLQAQVTSGVKGEPATTTPGATAADMSDEDMESLKEDFPTVYKALMATQAQARALEAQLKPVQDRVNQTAAEQQNSIADQVRDAIDSTPKLAHIAAVDPEAYELAKGFDNMLKQQPAWAGKSLSERFAKVIELVEQTNGAITIPGQATPPVKTAAQLQAEAMTLAAAQSKGNRTNVPASLSDFPAGEAPASDAKGIAESMTTLQLADKFARMTPDQMDAYFQDL